MKKQPEQDMESNAGASDVSGMEMNSFRIHGGTHPGVSPRQDTENILVYAGVGMAIVAVTPRLYILISLFLIHLSLCGLQICVYGLHAGVARVLFPQSTQHHHHWAGSATVSNDVQLEPENTPPLSGSPLGDPALGKGHFEKNFPFAFSLHSDPNKEMDAISEQQFRQAIHKIHIHLLAMEKVLSNLNISSVFIDS